MQDLLGNLHVQPRWKLLLLILIWERLWAWEHFDKFVDEDGQTKAKYKYRAKDYMFDSRIYGTSNVKSHVPTCLEYPYQELPEGEHPLSKDGEDGNLVPKNFSNVAGRKALIEMIILDELSFRFVEGLGFKRSCKIL